MTELPNSWVHLKLFECVEKLDSGKIAERGWSPQCLSHPVMNASSWGVLKTTAIQMGSFHPEYNKALPDELEAKAGLEVKNGDFLVTTTGPRNRCGVVCRVRATPKKLIFSGKILRFRANRSFLLPDYLMYLLISPDYQNILDGLKVGTSDSSVSIGNQQILDLEIICPPLAEQQKIVEALEDHLSRLDAALSDVKQAKEKAAQFRRALLQAAFTGNLTSDGTRIMTNMKTTKLVNVVDAAWGDTSKTKSSYVESGYTAFSAAGPDGFLKYFDYEQDGIVLSAIGANCGKVYFATGKWSCIKNTMRFLVKDDQELSIKFLYYALSNPNAFVRRGSGQPFIRQQDVRDIDFTYPPLSEQQKIVEILEDHLSRLDASVALADSMEKQSANLRRALLQAACTGQLTKEVASV